MKILRTTIKVENIQFFSIYSSFHLRNELNIFANSGKKNQIKKTPPVKSKSADLDAIVDKYFWLVIPIFAVIYFISSKYSTGFYQDDEIGQYINMIQFWTDPFAILGNSPKPGYKIFMVLPSLFGYDTVLAFNSIIASLTVYFTYILLKVYKIKYAFFGALLLSVQPLFLIFRSGLMQKYLLRCFCCLYCYFIKKKIIFGQELFADIFLW